LRTNRLEDTGGGGGIFHGKVNMVSQEKSMVQQPILGHFWLNMVDIKKQTFALQPKGLRVPPGIKQMLSA
jgi:hypothetical protein